MGKDRIIMHSWLKRISTALLTSLMLVSFIAVSVSASETNVSSAYTAPSGATLTYRSLIQKKKWESERGHEFEHENNPEFEYESENNPVS